ncbi:MAG: hypothetical protein WAM14_21365 [Candidatus Nitrosopolaris sp.]
MELTKEDLVWLKADMRRAKDKKLDSLVELYESLIKKVEDMKRDREKPENK